MMQMKCLAMAVVWVLASASAMSQVTELTLPDRKPAVDQEEWFDGSLKIEREQGPAEFIELTWRLINAWVYEGRFVVSKDESAAVEFRNGEEVIRIESVYFDEKQITIEFPHYDSKIIAELSGRLLVGKWMKNRGGDQPAEMKFVSNVGPEYGGVCGNEDPIIPNEILERAGGTWSIRFGKSGEAVGEFVVVTGEPSSNAEIHGTIRTPTGDFRYLSGRVASWKGYSDRSTREPHFWMSAFDGAHAFSMDGYMDEEGRFSGSFYSGNWHHETWTAVRDENAQLPDAFKETAIADEDALGEMVFKDLEGTPTRVLDLLDESNGKARIIEIFGTWCPNCTDAGRELVSLRAKYGDDLAVVGLAFEITEDFDRSVTQVKRHHEHIGTDWPILIAGLSDKTKASAALPVLDKVRSYPTLIFLNKDNEAQAVYTGFTGPATGEAYKEQRQRFEALIEAAIAE